MSNREEIKRVEISSNELFWYIKNGERVRQIRRVITHPSETCLDDREETIGILCEALSAKERETVKECAEIVKKTIKDEFENTLSGQTYYVCRPDPSVEILEHFGLEDV